MLDPFPCAFCHLFTVEWPIHQRDLNVSRPALLLCSLVLSILTTSLRDTFPSDFTLWHQKLSSTLVAGPLGGNALVAATSSFHLKSSYNQFSCTYTHTAVKGKSHERTHIYTHTHTYIACTATQTCTGCHKDMQKNSAVTYIYTNWHRYTWTHIIKKYWLLQMVLFVHKQMCATHYPTTYTVHCNCTLKHTHTHHLLY